MSDSGWFSVKEIAQITGWPERTVQQKCKQSAFGDHQKLVRGNGGLQYRVSIASPLIPAEVRLKMFGSGTEQIAAVETADLSVEAEILASAPEYAQRKAKKYLALLQMSDGLHGSALRHFVAEHNARHPDAQTSYPRVMDARAQYKDHGIAGLLGKWGKNAGTSSVSDELFAYFRALYMKEGAPGLSSCWKITLGYAQKLNPETTVESFPSVMAFHRRLKRESIPEAIYAARYGMKAANRRFNMYLKRDYNSILAGEVWVSDHCQVDVACSYIDKRTGKQSYCFPWATVWRDFKSGKWLGWELRPEAPSSDPIFLSMYRSGVQYGISSYVYLDNGKDYRCRDFAGGRSVHKLAIDEYNFRSLTGALQITPVFAWPYNAQSKPVERDFLRNKEWLSKHARGYRGGNVVEKPESLNETIRAGQIDTIEAFSSIFDTFVTEVVNRSIVSSGHRAGKCPDEIWDAEYPEACRKGLVKRVSADALKLFCSRTSRDLTVGRRGIRDSELGIDYYDHWMEAYKGRKVYLRRDPRAFQDAWVFDSADNSYIGKAYLLQETPALARTDVEKAALQADIRLRRNAQAVIKSFARNESDIPLEEKVEHMARATKMLNEARGYQPSLQTEHAVAHVATQMDRVLAEEEANQKRGRVDIGPAIPEPPDEEAIDVWAAWG